MRKLKGIQICIVWLNPLPGKWQPWVSNPRSLWDVWNLSRNIGPEFWKHNRWKLARFLKCHMVWHLYIISCTIDWHRILIISYIPECANSTIFCRVVSGKGRPETKTPPNWLTPECPGRNCFIFTYYTHCLKIVSFLRVERTMFCSKMILGMNSQSSQCCKNYSNFLSASEVCRANKCLKKFKSKHNGFK